MINTDNKGFTIENLNVFNSEFQPTLPKGFPQERVPHEVCGLPLAQLLLCTMEATSNQCGNQSKIYYMCRRERDAHLFGAVQ